MLQLKGNPLKCDCHAANLKMMDNPGLVISFTDYNCDDKSELLCPAADVDMTCGDQCQCLVNPYIGHVNIHCHQTNLTQVLSVLESYPNYTISLKLNQTVIDDIEDIFSHKLEELHVLESELNEFKMPKIQNHLKVINFNQNNMKTISTETVEHLSRSDLKLNLGNNLLDCSCQNKELLLHIQSQYGNVVEKVSFNCQHLKDKDILAIEVADICNEHLILILIISVSCFVVIVMIAIIILVFQSRDYIRLFLFTKCRFLFSEETLDKDKKYDAFISYCHQDEIFVEDYLVPGKSLINCKLIAYIIQLRNVG